MQLKHMQSMKKKLYLKKKKKTQKYIYKKDDFKNRFFLTNKINCARIHIIDVYIKLKKWGINKMKNNKTLKQDLETLRRDINLLEQILRENPSTDGKKQLEELKEEYKGLTRKK